MGDMNLNTNGKSYLFFYIILCSYANFRTSYVRIESRYFTVYPGHWVCKFSELSEWFHSKNRKKTLDILDGLVEKNLISYSLLYDGKIVHFKIKGWRASNVILEYNAPCQKEDGFFFFPISNALKLVNGEKCSEADILMDIWLNTVLNDVEVTGSNLGPIAYFRDFRDTALVSNSELAKRWGISRTTVFRVLKKLRELDYIDTIHFSGASGSVIYTKKYMQTMFEVEEVYIDRNDVVAVFDVEERIQVKNDDTDFSVYTSEELDCEKITGSNDKIFGSKMNKRDMVRIVQEILVNHGVDKFEKQDTIYKLSVLSLDCKGCINHIILTVESREKAWHFEVKLHDIADG